MYTARYRHTLKGPDRGKWEFDLVAEAEQHGVEHFEVTGDTVTVRLLERNRFTVLLELDPFDMDVRYVVRAVARGMPQCESADGVSPPVAWLDRFPPAAPQGLAAPRPLEEQLQPEGAGLDGLIAKPLDGTYQPGKRSMYKIKHERTADCVVAGYRIHKSGGRRIGSLLLGLYDGSENLVSVGVVGAFPMARRAELFEELQPWVTTFDDHPWAWATQEEGERTPRKSETSRWNAGKDLSFVPLRPERVVEVRYDYMEGVRFRHTTQFVRWRDDRDPASCTYDQLERPVTFDLAEVLASG